MDLTSAVKAGGEDEARCIVLVLRSEHDAWGLRIDRAGTFISREKPEYHPPRLGEHGAMFIGDLTCEGKRYAILDAEATWRGLRSTIVRWYGLINEPGFYTALPLDEKARAFAMAETG